MYTSTQFTGIVILYKNNQWWGPELDAFAYFFPTLLCETRRRRRRCKNVTYGHPKFRGLRFASFAFFPVIFDFPVRSSFFSWFWRILRVLLYLFEDVFAFFTVQSHIFFFWNTLFFDKTEYSKKLTHPSITHLWKSKKGFLHASLYYSWQSQIFLFEYIF